MLPKRRFFARLVRTGGFLDKGLDSGRSAFARLSTGWLTRSRVFVTSLHANLERAVPLWISAVMLVGTLKMFQSPMPPDTLREYFEILLPYSLLALGPTIALRLALAAFPDGVSAKRLDFHLSRVGRWQPVDASAATQQIGFGTYGLMACLMFGLLLNVPLRTAEFMLAVPALHGAAPDWGRAIFLAMAADVIAMNFLYVTSFVMAYRRVPLFPRMLLAVWLIDITLQFTIASIASSYTALPTEVAFALEQLLQGNLAKVLISMAVWLPYLILSDRVNLTYRLRIRAR